MILTEVAPPQDDEFEVLKNGLNGFNETNGASTWREVISSFAKDKNNKTVGGILGELHWGWMYVKGLWVSESFRGQGLGSILLNKAEQYAVSKGITNFRLETTSFQALSFYQKQGYEVFGELPDMPPMSISYFLKKQVGK